MPFALSLSDPGPAAHTRGLVAVHLAVVLFGFAGLFGQWLVLSPVVIVLGRTTVAAATLVLIGRGVGARMGRLDLRLAASGAVLGVHWLAFFAAIQRSSVAIGLLGYASFPVFTLLLEIVLLRRRASARDGLVCALVVAGLVLVVPRWSAVDANVQGLALGIASGFGFALLAVMNRRESARRPALDIAFWQNAAAAVCLAPFAVPAWIVQTPTARDIALIAVLGVACTALAHTLFISGLRHVSAHAASVIAALEPVYGIALAWWLMGQTPSLRMWIGAGLLVSAAAAIAPRQRGVAVAGRAQRMAPRGRIR